MNNTYENAPATKMLATFCCVCGLPLVDAISVEMGIGPECRKGNNDGITEAQRTACNKLTHQAAVAAQNGSLAKVAELAEQIRALGLIGLADKIATRFQNAERLAKIEITERDGWLAVSTPYKRSASAEFIDAWRDIPGRKWDGGVNRVPVSSKRALWTLLTRFFPGVYGKGPQGLFRVPVAK